MSANHKRFKLEFCLLFAVFVYKKIKNSDGTYVKYAL